MIASVLFNATADDVRFILIDPKMLELSIYEDIPHLLVPVVVDPEKAAAALLWATQEMETALRDDARPRRAQHRRLQPRAQFRRAGGRAQAGRIKSAMALSRRSNGSTRRRRSSIASCRKS